MAQDVRLPNVRFFLGTREQYNVLTKHNPLALYFCQDTGELFRGGQCISDGVRVVQSLPEIAQAAKGKLYYIAETHEGFIVAPDGTSWLQIIHAKLDVSLYYTKEEVKAAIADAISKAAIEGAEIDLSGYALKSDIPDVSNFISEIPDEYITEKELSEKGYLTEHQDLSEYAKKSDIPEKADLSGYALKTDIPDVSSFITEVPANYITDDELSAKGYLTEHQDLSDYALKNSIPVKTSQLTNDSGFITIIPEEYITEPELSAKLYATEGYVNNKIASIPEPDLTGYAKKSDLPDLTIYTKKAELPDFALYAKKTDLPDLTPYLKEVPAEFVTEAELSNKGYLTEHQSLAGYAKTSDIPTNLSQFANDSGYITAKDIPAPDLSAYAKKSDIPDVSDFITEIPSEYVTDSELSNKGYLTEHQSLVGYATEDYVLDAINNIELPEQSEVDLSGYYTKTETAAAISSAILDKANKIPFKTAKQVAVACGGFAVGDSLEGLTITQIFAKLLGLNATPGDDSGGSAGTTTAVGKIMNEELPMYQISTNGQLEEVPYSYVTMTDVEAEQAPTEACFYQIITKGTVVESGYQHFAGYENELFYMVALPNVIKINSAEMTVSIELWDNGSKEWKSAVGFADQLTCDMAVIQETCDACDVFVPAVPEGYTLWANLDAVNNGEVYRYIIEEVNT